MRILSGLVFAASVLAIPTRTPSAIGAVSCEQFVTKWGSQGSNNGQFNFPYQIAVDSSGNVYAADSGNNRIQKFTSTGGFVTTWGSSGSGPGQFNDPAG